MLPPSRRDALGLLALGGLALPDVLRLRAATARSAPPTAVIFVQLGGGASQFETYDPKPEAPAEYRGAFSSIPTRVPGVRFSELMPRQARLMDRLAVVRSVTHHEASHIALHVVESGYFLRNRVNALRGEMPAIGSVAARVRGQALGGLPGFVSLPRHQAYCTPAWLGAACAPFSVEGDPNAPDFTVANLALRKGLSAGILGDRQTLRRSFDEASLAFDEKEARGLDTFQAQAFDLLTGDKVRTAFDVGQEPAPLRQRYGQNSFGQRLLLARRLAEAGVPFVMVRTFDWDDHKQLPDLMKNRCPAYDQGMAALVSDLCDRSLDRDVLVVAMGEFGRTPKVNKDAGRDHWPAVSSVLLAGGRYRMGQAIGASDSKGGAVARAPYKPQNVQGMVYRHLGIDPSLTFTDFAGRPRHVLEEREPVAELL